MAHHIPKIEYGGFAPTVISFDYPPVEPDPERTVINRKISESISGARQVSFNNIEGIRKLKFRFVTEALKTSLESFVQTHAAQGGVFKYFDNKNGATYKVYELEQEKFEPKMITAVGENTYIYEVDLTMRRLVDDAIAEGYMQQDILNNQAVPLDITDLILDPDSYRSVRIFFEIFRKTSLSEIVANGSFVCTYKETTDSWDIAPGTYEGDAHGVTFSVTAAGQVQYTSDNMAGTSYEGNLLLRNFTIIGG